MSTPKAPQGYQLSREVRSTAFRLALYTMSGGIIFPLILIGGVYTRIPEYAYTGFGGIAAGVIHFLVQAMTYHVLEYHVNGTVSLAVVRQWQTVRDYLIVQLAPIAVVTPIFLSLLTVPVSTVTAFAAGVILGNTLLALVYNLGAIVHALKLPRTALLYEHEEGKLLVYEPTAS
jgi:hypothetical protein